MSRNNNSLLPIARNIRQELVSLTVSLEDKKQLLTVLREKVDNKRSQLESVETVIQENYSRLIEVSNFILY